MACVLAVLGVVLARSVRRLREPAYLELRQEEAALVVPGALQDPWTIPRFAVASLVLDPAGTPPKRQRTGNPLAAIANLSPQGGRPNLLVLLNQTVPLPPIWRRGLPAMTTPGFVRSKAWVSAGRPVTGFRVRLADLAAAGPQLQAWAPEPSAPVTIAPGEVPGSVDTAKVRRQQRWLVAIASGVVAVVLAISPFVPDPKVVAASAGCAAASGIVLGLALGAALRVRRRGMAQTLVSVIIVGTLLGIGLLLNRGPHWALYGALGGGTFAVVLGQFQAQLRLARQSGGSR